ncbi:hypothetical protein M2480_001406 [Parabacteroides sp. PFB2-12]|uniref:hypothetical protein n=1 Tax=unclassified Parabacteroides TaxID=2649774 RepID=UPI002473BF8F|nr:MULTISPECIES: hypothetical protein [unclassified Parabacteroides]MDH6343054.1 hypothetical protein [Parabacteroides sp. PM6-13]MDH6390433.1 hypothetical protein [Parabacteroides sp. PFB2-12]
MRIDDLLEKYFEGETTAAEEKELRTFFSSGPVAEHLAPYQPLFAYFDEEIARKEEKEEAVVPAVAERSARRRVFYMVSGIAASLLLLLGIGQIFFFEGRRYCADNYVIINGRCYTDVKTIREHAFRALEEVATTSEELIPTFDRDEMDRQIIEEQLNDLRSLFDEEE